MVRGAMTDLAKWRGLKALLVDAVEHGSRAIERVHLETAKRPFAILEQIPVVAEPAKLVHEVHDAVVGTTYALVRTANRAAGLTVDVALDAVERGHP